MSEKTEADTQDTEANETGNTESAAAETEGTEAKVQAPKKQNPIGRVIFLAITAACFAYLYYRLNGAAARESLPLTEYMSQVFANVAW
ncbi:MAG TPA: hypothetical protein DCR00_06875, partial [Gammaproteobacteria bacterium]|nr:hypothetical protein [Gammaproteobacteria bacterium]